MKLTIVTVTLNNLAGLQATLASLANQTSLEFEQWVIDGGSTDGSRELLAGYRAAWRLQFLAEPDRGIYDAMNKGTTRASGDYVWFLNAGDTCADATTVEAILRALAGDAAIDVLHGRVWARSTYGRRSVGGPVTRRDFLTRMPICHQGLVYRRSLLQELPYPVEYRLVADWIVTRTLFERGAKFGFLDRHLAIYDLAGVSSRAHAGALSEMLRHEKSAGGKLRLLAGQGGHLLGLWVAKKTGLYHWYKLRQHARPPAP